MGSGRYYARLGQREFIPAPVPEGTLQILLFESFDAEWFDRHEPPDSASEQAKYYEEAELYVLQAPVQPDDVRRFRALESVTQPVWEDSEDAEWFVIEAFPSEGQRLMEGELRITVHANLYDAGTPAAVKSVQTVDAKTTQRLRKTVSTAHFPTATEAAIDHALAGLASIEWAVVYDVGQGNAIGLCDGNGFVQTYFDLGGGVLGNARTFPTALTNFCFTNSPPIILSHWDFDHWSSANRDKHAHSMTWIAPRQAVGPTHVALMTSIVASGTLLFVPATLKPTWRGQLYLELCTGSGRNYSGLALTLAEKLKGKGERMLFPGDARYDYVPSFPPSRDYLSVVVPHHGADMRKLLAPSCSGLAASRLVYSFGPGNTFSHPRHVTRQDHDHNGWHDPLITSGAAAYEVRETAYRIPGPLGHVLLGWKTHATAPALPCGAKHCQLRAEQL